MQEQKKISITEDAWFSLKAFTTARIALGKTGTALPLNASLEFKLAHAHARDAVYSVLNKDLMLQELAAMHQPCFLLRSKAGSRSKYLQRPDLGTQLHADSAKQLTAFENTGFDIAITIADGLSATAVNSHAIPLLQKLILLLQKDHFTIAPVCIAEQARVAISDETGSLLKAKISLILIGERPGLSSHDSLGAYLTYNPVAGTTNERRNCISNIRPEGLSIEHATDKICYLIKESLRLKLSGVQLKDNMGLLPL
jgi:ethanolamine ammonia-lyase small subunit